MDDCLRGEMNICTDIDYAHLLIYKLVRSSPTETRYMPENLISSIEQPFPSNATIEEQSVAIYACRW